MDKKLWSHGHSGHTNFTKAYHFEPKTDHVMTKFDQNDPISDQISFFFK